MDMIERYLPYWPVLAAAVCFFALGMVLFFRGELAMERSPKPLSWVPAYRCKEALGDHSPRGGLLPLIAVVLFSLLVAVGYRVLKGGLDALSPDLRSLGAVLIACLGAAAAYLTLRLLFGSVLVSLCGSLLFSASFLGSHTALCLLTAALFLTLLYLRQQEKRWFAELLYGVILVLFALAVAVTPKCVWLLPAPIALHWVKNTRWLRGGMQGVGRFIGDLALSLLWWAIAVAAFVLLRTPLLRGEAAFSDALSVEGFLRNAEIAWADLLLRLFVRLKISRLLFPILDAPMAVLGLFGAVSALRMAVRRRDVRGSFALAALGCFALVWIINNGYAMTLGFLLTAGCLLYNCVRGRRIALAITFTALGVLYQIALHWAAWYLPLYEPIVQKLA